MKKSSESEFGDTADKPKNIGRTAQKIIDLVISDLSMSAEAMAYKLGISSRAVENKSQNCVLWVYCLVKAQTLVVIGVLF